MPTLNSYSIKRKIFSSYKYELNLYIPPVETIYTNNQYIVNPNAILYLSLPWPKNNNMIPEEIGKRSFIIRHWNHRKILRKFSEALAWFTDPQLKDLYIIGDDQKLYFNTAYSDLSVKYSPKYMETPQAFKITPITIEYANGVYQEGVRIYLNKSANFMELTVEELQELFDILYDFNFPAEIQVSYQALMFSINSNKLVSNEEYKQRLTQLR